MEGYWPVREGRGLEVDMDMVEDGSRRGEGEGGKLKEDAGWNRRKGYDPCGRKIMHRQVRQYQWPTIVV